MKPRSWMSIMTISVIVSLVLNVALLYALVIARGAALNSIVAMRSSVATWSRQPLVMQVHVEQDVPLETVVPLSQTISIPLDFDYPLSTVINTGFNVPLLGHQEVAIPIETMIPIQYTVDVPLQIEVPISLTYHLETDLPVQVQLPPELGTQLDHVLTQLEQLLQRGTLQIR